MRLEVEAGFLALLEFHRQELLSPCQLSTIRHLATAELRLRNQCRQSRFQPRSSLVIKIPDALTKRVNLFPGGRVLSRETAKRLELLDLHRDIAHLRGHFPLPRPHLFGEEIRTVKYSYDQESGIFYVAEARNLALG